MHPRRRAGRDERKSFQGMTPGELHGVTQYTQIHGKWI
jgi:hypothetical protein